MSTISSISLTVRSKDGVNYDTPVTELFVVDRIGTVRANQNLTTAQSITEAGDGASQLSAWGIYGADGETLTWILTNSSSTRKVSLYRGTSTTNLLVATGTVVNDGIIYLNTVNESGVSGVVTVAYSADDTGTVIVNNYVATTELQINGASQFDYEGTREEISVYTVDETVTQINSMLNDNTPMYETTGTLSQAQLVTMYTTPITLISAPGTGKTIIVDSIEWLHSYSTADYTGGGDVFIQYQTGSPVALVDIDKTILTAHSVLTGYITPSAYGLDASAGTGLGYDYGAVSNIPLSITNATAVFAAGNAANVLKYKIRYKIVTVLV